MKHVLGKLYVDHYNNYYLSEDGRVFHKIPGNKVNWLKIIPKYAD